MHNRSENGHDACVALCTHPTLPADRSGHTVLGVGLDRFNAEAMGLNPA
jgi:hypothetical protein